MASVARLRTFFAVMLALACIFSTGITAQEDAYDMASKIVAMEQAWNQAFTLRDVKALDALLANNIVLVNDDGSFQSKQDFIAWIRAAKPSDGEQVSPESISVRFSGNVAVATGTFVVKGVVGGKPHERMDRFADTWVFSHGVWQCISATATPVVR